jgi:hypothetical protein
MKNVKYSSVIWQEGEHFVAQCLNVEVSSFGDSKEEASFRSIVKQSGLSDSDFE